MRRRGLQDLIGPAQLAVLALQRLEPLALVAGQPRAEAVIGLGSADPLAQRLCRDADLVRDGGDRRPLRGVLVLVLEHQSDGPLPQLWWVPARSCHGSNLSRVGASRNPGAIHQPASQPGAPTPLPPIPLPDPSPQPTPAQAA
jgi:hypothetical protein